MKALFLLLAFISSAVMASTPLGITQDEAFATLGYNCGGIKIFPHVSGFDTSGNPQATTFMYTSCSGGGRGSNNYHTVWIRATWDLTGKLLSQVAIAAPCQGLWCVPPGLYDSYSANGYTLSKGTQYDSIYTLNYYPAILNP
jgi:hypothetical protein